MSKTKKQHYVPQSYLKRFAHDSQRLWVFDKVSGIIFKSNVIDVAQKRYFYDLPERANNLGIDVQSAEKVLAVCRREIADATVWVNSPLNLGRK